MNLKTWVVKVRDGEGRVHAVVEQALDRREALENFRDRVGWPAKKFRQRLVECVEKGTTSC